MKSVAGGMKAPPSMGARKAKTSGKQMNPKAGGQKAPPSMSARKAKDHPGQGKTSPISAPPRNSAQPKGTGGTGMGKSWP